jgi:hypothetical protein
MTRSQHDGARSVAPEEIRADGTWPPRPVAQEPSYVLIRWRVVSIRGALRLVGYNLTNDEGRLSSRLVAIDVMSRAARTESGRIYVLEGPWGFDADAEWVLQGWLHRYGARSEEVHDYTQQLVAVLAGARR